MTRFRPYDIVSPSDVLFRGGFVHHLNNGGVNHLRLITITKTVVNTKVKRAVSVFINGDAKDV